MIDVRGDRLCGGNMDILGDRFVIGISGDLIKLKPEDIINNHLEKNLTQGFNENDRLLWQHYEFIEHLVRLAKTQALIKLQQR